MWHVRLSREGEPQVLAARRRRIETSVVDVCEESDMARLRLNASGRWEIYGGMHPLRVDEVTSGEVIYVEVEGEDGLERTRIEYDHGRQAYISVAGYPLWDGMRAERDAKDA